MPRYLFLACLSALVLVCLFSAAQAQEVSRLEIGVHVTALSLGDFKLKVPDFSKTERGAGARVTLNLTDGVALEAEYNLFPENFRITVPQLNQLVTRRLTRDRVNQILFGVKAGTRSDRFGLFAKIRPGFVSSQVRDEVINPNPTLNTLFRTSSGLALDFGAVLELYPTKGTIFRLDVSDMMIRYETNMPQTGTTPTTNLRRFATHNLQVGAGFGLRF